MRDGRAAPLYLDGRRLGPDIPQKIGYASHIALLDGIIVVGDYEAESITAYELSTARVVWAKFRIQQIHSLSATAHHNFVLDQLDGRCALISGSDGTQLRAWQGIVPGVCSDSFASTFLQLHGQAAHGEKDLVCIEGATGAELWRRPIVIGDIPRSVFGVDWIAITENEYGELICLNVDGSERWRQESDPESHYPCLSRTREGDVFVIRRSKRRGPSNMAACIGAQNGNVLWERHLPDEYLAYHPANHGDVLIECVGLLKIPDLEWTWHRLKVE